MINDKNEAAAPTLEELESLFVNNVDLEKIRAYLGRFNPIKTMAMERMEIRHSAILAWLLNPQETHGLGDSFLKAFLSEALQGHSSTVKPSALDVSQADLMDAEIRREWHHIDLLVLSARNGWIFVIENKFDSRQHSNQLERYMNDVESVFKEKDSYQYIRGIFLTLWDEEPEDGRYAPIQYTSICNLLEQHILKGRRPISSEVETFLKHYLDVIQEATGMSQEQESLEKLARQLYRNHRRVIDFIVENGMSTDFSIACEKVFGENIDYPDIISVEDQDLVFIYSDLEKISFLPKSWFDAFGGDCFYWRGCESWGSGFPISVWLQLTSDGNDGSGKIRFYAEVGPLEDSGFRTALVEEIERIAQERNLNKIGFQHGASEKNKKSSKFFKKNFFTVDDVHDSEKIEAALKKAIKSFKNEIEVIAEVLPQFLPHGKAEPLE
tara:strand:- start:880 stop:2196 length:1317 start_codon:yes stop_codon:yes gene_type:complete